MKKSAMRGIDERGGRFRVRVGSGTSRVNRTFGSLAEAQEYRDACYAEVSGSGLVAPRGATMRDIGRAWLRTRRSHLRSYVNDRSRWSCHVEPSAIADVPIKSISRRDARAFRDHLDRNCGAASSVDRVLALVRKFFEDQIEDEMIGTNPFRKIRSLAERSPIAPDWYLTVDEQRAFCEAIPTPERHIVAFAIYTGLRLGEQWNLHLVDVRIDDPAPSIMVRWGGFKKGRLVTTKNKRTRKVPLLPMAASALRAWLAALPTYVPRNPLGLVFPTRRGSRRNMARMPAGFHAARAAVPRIDVWWHLLRHTCASSLVGGWWGAAWTLAEVRDFLGHHSVTVTERYAHLAPSALDAKAAATVVLTQSTREVDSSMNSSANANVDDGIRRPMQSGLSSADPGVADQLRTIAVNVLRAAASGDARVHGLAVTLASRVLDTLDAGDAATSSVASAKGGAA